MAARIIAALNGIGDVAAYQGPTSNSTTAVFSAVIDRTTNKLRVVRSVDAGFTWFESDLTNAPDTSAVQYLAEMATASSGSRFFLLYQGPDESFRIATFNMATNLWEGFFAGGPANDASLPCLAFGRRSTGTFVVVISTRPVFAQADVYTCGAGGGWAGPHGTISSGNDELPLNLVIDASDRAHIFTGTNGPANQIHHTALSSANVLGFTRSMAGDVYTPIDSGTENTPHAAYDVTNDRVFVPVIRLSTNILHILEAPAVEDPLTWSDRDLAVAPWLNASAAGQMVACIRALAVNYVFFPFRTGDGTGSLRYLRDLGGGWETGTGTELYHSAGNIHAVAAGLVTDTSHVTSGVGVVFNEDPTSTAPSADMPTRTMYVLFPLAATGGHSYSF